MNPIESIPDNDLTYKLYLVGAEKAEAERQYDVSDLQRLPVLAEVTSWYVGEGLSQGAAERAARVSQEYQQHIKLIGDNKFNMSLLRAKYKAVDGELRKRLSDHYRNGGNNV